MRRIAAFAYGLLAYAAFLFTFLYMIGFLGGFVVRKSINDGEIIPISRAMLIDTLLIALFGIQHSIMARPAFKTRWTRLIPPPIERSTFVLVASAILALIFWQWRPIPTVVWRIDDAVARAALTTLFFAGWAIVLYSSFLIDHFDLFGIRHVFLYLRSREYTHPPLIVRSLYTWVRHPLMAGFLIALWSAPTMTLGHLLFSTLMTGYILVGIAFEERDLARALGDQYLLWRSQTPMLIPLMRKGALPIWRRRRGL